MVYIIKYIALKGFGWTTSGTMPLCDATITGF
jgi:hypothetical protein